MKQQLAHQLARKLLHSEDISTLPLSELEMLFRSEHGIDHYLPDGSVEIDPRNGDRILFNSARSRRPHDNRSQKEPIKADEGGCVICQGQTTGIIDLAELSNGFTFINKNLFPVLYPFTTDRAPVKIIHGNTSPDQPQPPVKGLHFLQWTSSLHDKDWHNMPLSDRLIAMSRLAALEKMLLTGNKDGREIPLQSNRSVIITKNFGHQVGGSLSHGHQQIAFSPVTPGRFLDNQRFEEQRGETFSQYLQSQNPATLAVKSYGPATLLVPYFMRRPYDMMLLVKDTGKQYLHQLNRSEITAVVDGWRDAIRAIRLIMPEIGRDTAYVVTTHNGPGAGIYFEFLPYTQENGGFEQLGLLACQADPLQVTTQIRQALAV